MHSFQTCLVVWKLCIFTFNVSSTRSLAVANQLLHLLLVKLVVVQAKTNLCATSSLEANISYNYLVQM